MKQYLNRMTKKTGLPPGDLIHIGPEKTEPIQYTLVRYGTHGAEFFDLSSPSDIAKHRTPNDCCWLDVRGVHQPELIHAIGTLFDLHSLILEDVVTTSSLPKLEEGGLGLFMIIKAIRFDGTTLNFEHIALCLQSNVIVSFQEQTTDTFQVIKTRMAQKKGKILEKNTDYLLYALVDYVIDTYFETLQTIDHRISTLNQEVDDCPTHETLKHIQALKNHVLMLKRYFWYTRDSILLLKKSESPLIDEKTGKYLTDLHEHITHIIDISESFREELIDLSERHLAAINLRSNDITKLLTIVSAIFLPLTFMTGIYGMNFTHMAELNWPYAYPLLLLCMLGIVGLLLVLFKRKRWFD